MRRGWTVDDHRVELEINALILTVRVDGAQAFSMRSNLLGAWPISLGKRVVELRRVRSFDVAVTQLWVDGTKVPPSPEPLSRQAADAGARCKIHPSSAGSDAPAAATIACAICRALVCAACRGVDGVRCRECFERAVEELRRHDRANRIKGPLLGVAMIAALALVGWATHSVAALECAGGAAVLFAFLIVRGLFRERAESVAR